MYMQLPKIAKGSDGVLVVCVAPQFGNQDYVVSRSSPAEQTIDSDGHIAL